MANYMLSIKRANGFEELMWNKVEGFEYLNVHNLQDLDKFTTSYENEEKMKLALLMAGVMKPSDASKSLTIKYKSRGSYKTLMYGPAYKKDKKFFLYDYQVYDTNHNFIEYTISYHHPQYTKCMYERSIV